MRPFAIMTAGVVAASLAGATVGVSAATAEDDPGSTSRVSVSSGGAQADNESDISTVSANGRYVAFFSLATNLVPGDENGTWDLFMRDLRNGSTRRVSVSTGGAEADDTSWGSVALSERGRFVAFESFARNLVAGDSNDMWDVFVRDRALKTTERVSLSSGGAQGNSGSTGVAISANGRYVAFSSFASNLVAGDTNQRDDVFVRDRATGRTTRVSVRSNGGQANGYSFGAAVSANGRYVAFYSNAANLVAGDTNRSPDAFVRDRATGTTTRVSVRSNGAQANSESYVRSISADGRYILFTSWASNVVAGDANGVPDAFVHDRATGTTRRVSVASGGTESNGESGASAISADGRYVVFTSQGSNLVNGDTDGDFDVFLRDRATRTTSLVSSGIDGSAAGGVGGAISENGQYIAFQSPSADIVPDDTNGHTDVFLRLRGANGP